MRRSDPVYGLNFNLVGVENQADTEVHTLTRYGFYTKLMVGTGELNAMDGSSITLSGVQLDTGIVTIGAAAIIEFRLSNLNVFDQTVTVIVYADIMVNGMDDADVYDLDHGGFRVQDAGTSARASAQFRFYAKNHPLVTDASTYWFGPFANWTTGWLEQTTAESFTTGDSAMAMSWKDLTIKGHGGRIITFVVAGGTGSSPPVLNVDTSGIPGSINWDTPLVITGTASDPENEAVSVVVVLDEDVSQATRIATQLPSGSEFYGQVNLHQHGVTTPGVHTVDIYAFDSSGMSSPATRVQIDVIAPTIALTETPHATPTATQSTLPQSTRPATETPTRSSSLAATSTPLPHVNMRLREPNLTYTAFALEGWYDGSDTPIAPSATGFNLLWQTDDGMTNYLYQMRQSEHDGVSVNLLVHVFGPTAIVVITGYNANANQRALNVCLEADIRLIENDGAPIYSLDSWNGFNIVEPPAHFTVICRNHPLVVNTDTYWYGAWGGRYQNYWKQVTETSTNAVDTAVALSWQHRVIPPRSKIALSVVMSWIGDTTPPQLDMSQTSLPLTIGYRERLSFSGTVSDAEDQLMSVFVIVDSDYSSLVPLMSDLSGRTFTTQLSVSDDLHMTVGRHVISACAIDGSGTASREAASWTIDVTGPTASADATPRPTVSNSPAATLSRSRTAFETRTRSQSPPPTGTPAPYYLMHEGTPGYAQNFVLLGHTAEEPNIDIRMSHSGADTNIREAYGTFAIHGKEPLVTAGNILVETAVTLMGAAAVVVLNITNLGTSSQSVDVSIEIDLLVNGNDHAPCSDFDGHVGFAAFGDSARVNFFTKEHALVTDMSTYWFGPWNNRTANRWLDAPYSSFGGADSAMAMTWQNRLVRSGERIALSTLITWGTGSTAPTLVINSDLTNPINWATTFHITGTVSDPDGQSQTIIVVPDDDYGLLKVLGRDVLPGNSFSFPLKFQDFNIRSANLHHLDVYAVDISGTVSAPVRFEAYVQAPTLPLTATPGRSPLPTPTGGLTRSRTVPPTRSPWPTPPPFRSPPGDLLMQVTGDVDSHTNFRLQASGPSMGGDIVHVSNTGFNSRYVLSTGVSGRLVRLEPSIHDDVFIGTRVTPIGASAVIAYEILNFGTTPVSINLSLDTDVNLFENDDAPIHSLPDGTGMRVEGGPLHFRVYTNNYPLVVDADTYWYGSFFELEQHIWDQTAPGFFFAGDDSAFAVSWQNRVVPARGRIVLSCVMTWYGDSSPPTINMGTTNLPSRVDWQSQMTLSGTVSQENGYSIHLALVTNNDFGFIWPLGEAIQSGSAFSLSRSPAQLGIWDGGKHSFDIYAFDQRGAVAAPVTFTIEVMAPTRQPSPTHRKSPTRSQSFKANTPNPTLDPNDAGSNTGDASGSGSASANGGAKAAIGVLLPIGIIIILVVGYLILCHEKRRGFAAGADGTADLNEVGSYTI